MRAIVQFTLAALLGMLAATPAAADGRTVITQEKALAGNITTGDGPGFPIQLTQPGSYVLDSNLLVPAGKNGISVTSQNVTIDLNGFTLGGNNRTALNGIVAVDINHLNLAVKNGTIWDFKTSGVRAVQSMFVIVDGVRVHLNGAEGIHIHGYGTVTNSDVSANLGRGILCGAYCHIVGNNISGNMKDGVYLTFGSVLNNTINYNFGLGIATFYQGPGVEVGAGGNTLVGNNRYGFYQTTPLLAIHPNACSPDCEYVVQEVEP